MYAGGGDTGDRTWEDSDEIGHMENKGERGSGGKGSSDIRESDPALIF